MTQLAAARASAARLKTSAVVVGTREKVIDAWGDVDRAILVRSIRKSLLSMLFGTHVSSGKIRLDASLAELGIDDEPPLTTGERTATVRDLLEMRSGIYHPAAAEDPKMLAAKPARGAYPPGSRWCYNNWDANALGTIFTRATGVSIVEEFYDRIARPLGMEFTPDQGRLVYEPASDHPAYPFWLSALDLLLVGQLMLQRGSWRGQQLVPSEWIDQITASHSHAPYDDAEDGYGYLWWVREDAFSARGWGGHYLEVFPSRGIVIVHRVHTQLGSQAVAENSVSWEDYHRFRRTVLNDLEGVSR
jgi:CubicO group peptidase (beta-lactamase class C family)